MPEQSCTIESFSKKLFVKPSYILLYKRLNFGKKILSDNIYCCTNDDKFREYQNWLIKHEKASSHSLIVPGADAAYSIVGNISWIQMRIIPLIFVETLSANHQLIVQCKLAVVEHLQVISFLLCALMWWQAFKLIFFHSASQYPQH